MRLPAKIFFSVITVFSLVFLASGYFLLSHSFDFAIGREVDFALRQYQYDRFSVRSGMIANEDILISGIAENQDLRGFFEKITEYVSAPACFLSADGKELYNRIGEIEEISSMEFGGDSYWYKVVHREKTSYILFGSRILQDDLCLDFVTKTDITETVTQQGVLRQYYERCFYVAMLTTILLTLGLSIFLTNPLKRMTKAADRMAEGCYHERLPLRGKDEFRELAESFNTMAEAVEGAISDLSEEARKKEDFVANFAHEIKTPLTSVIGYADRIYQKDMPREEVKKSAWYIWNEGMRLEALSLKLMDLTNMNRQHLSYSLMPMGEMLQEVTEAMKETLSEQEIEIICEAENAYICVDYDLWKTLMLNLIDNAAKAESKRIEIIGKVDNESYHIVVSDDGKGIPERELSRITEAFYMVDKVRSRKQHGAGIGLALVKRIVEIHEGTLYIESKEKERTRVAVALPIPEGGGEIA